MDLSPKKTQMISEVFFGVGSRRKGTRQSSKKLMDMNGRGLLSPVFCEMGRAIVEGKPTNCFLV